MRSSWGKSALLVAAVLSAAPALAADPAGWQVKREASAIDGLKSVSAYLVSDNEMPNSSGRQAHAYLHVQCLGRQVGLYVVWPRLVPIRARFGIDGAYKIDDAPPVLHIAWDESSDGDGTFVPLRLLAQMMGQVASAKTFVVRTESLDGGPQEATFSLKGEAGPLFTEVATACEPPMPPPLKPAGR